MNSAVKANPVAPMTKPVKAPKKRKAKSLDKAKARAGWFFVAPFVLIFVLIYVPVIIESITYSFSRMYSCKEFCGGWGICHSGHSKSGLPQSVPAF